MAGTTNLPDDLARYVNFPVNEAIRRAPADADQAAEVLLLAAKLMRDRQALPHQLADYLADAFEAAMAKPQETRVSELSFELNLQSRQKRPSTFDWMDAYKIMQSNPSATNAELIKKVQRAAGCGDSLARRLLNSARAAETASQQILAEESDTDG